MRTFFFFFFYPKEYKSECGQEENEYSFELFCVYTPTII